MGADQKLSAFFRAGMIWQHRAQPGASPQGSQRHHRLPV